MWYYKVKMTVKKLIAKTILTLGLAVAPLIGAAQPLFATATKPVNYCFMAKKLDGSDYTACQASPTDSRLISLKMGDKVRFAMRVGIEREVVDALQFRAYFPLKDPTYIMASVKPDSKPAQSLAVNLDLPSNSFLSYIPGTTLYTVINADDSYTDYPVADAGGRSALYANSGGYFTESNQGDAGRWYWSFMYFDMEVVSGDNAPAAPAPQMELEATVANLTDGESLSQKLAATTVASGDTVRVKYWIHNNQMYSVAKGVKLQVTDFAKGTVSGVNFDPLSDTVTITLEDGVTLSYVAGTARFHRYADAAGTALTADQATALFGSGLVLGNKGSMNGCWIYQEWIEFDLKASAVKGDDTPEDEEDEEMPEEEKPEVLAATGPENAFLTAAFLAYLGFLVRKVKLTRYL